MTGDAVDTKEHLFDTGSREIRPRKAGSATKRKILGLVWIDCPYPVVTQGLEEVLADHARLHAGREPPEDGKVTLILLCPDEAGDLVAEVEYLRRISPDTPVLIFGLRVDSQVGRAAFQAGANGFMHVGMQPAHIVNALSLARAGEVVIPTDLLKDLMTDTSSAGSPQTLTSRQEEILTLVAEGLTNAQIAQRLSLSEFTIKQHLRHTYKILGVSNRTQAANHFRKEEVPRTHR